MSASELEELVEKHKDEPLPQGWFFDGAVFVDYEGNRRTERPGKLWPFVWKAFFFRGWTTSISSGVVDRRIVR